MTRNTDAGPYGCRVRNEYDSNHLTRNDRRASLVPAAAVIPAPIAYVKVAAVKKLVVERPGSAGRGRPARDGAAPGPVISDLAARREADGGTDEVTWKKSGRSRRANLANERSDMG